jgi:lambda family phage tail tape measure protein
MKGMEDALVNFVKTGKLNFKDLADSIISDMIRIAIQKNITGPMASAIGSLFSQANGGAWSNGVQMFANGGIVSGPTAFGMAGGSMGVMGEAGAEAIMPLRRTSNGRLGVDVVGGLHDATAPNVSIYIENKSNGEVKQGSTNLQFDGKNFIISTIIENVQQNGPLRGLLGAGAY